MKATSSLLVAGVLLVTASNRAIAGTSVTGTVVDRAGHPLAGVACFLAGTPVSTQGTRVIYSGIAVPVFTDKDGRFSISLPQSESLADLQFDANDYAPAFLYRVGPEDSRLRVVMTEGKLLRGRIVDEQHAPIAHAVIELQMAQEDRWYQKRAVTDRNGEFRFKISEPPQESPWMLCYAGKRFEIDYSKVGAGAVFTLQADVRITFEAEPTRFSGPGDGAPVNNRGSVVPGR